MDKIFVNASKTTKSTKILGYTVLALTKVFHPLIHDVMFLSAVSLLIMKQLTKVFVFELYILNRLQAFPALSFKTH